MQEVLKMTIKEKLKKYKIPAAYVAQQAGISLKTLYNYKNGNVKATTALKIEKVISKIISDLEEFEIINTTNN